MRWPARPDKTTVLRALPFLALILLAAILSYRYHLLLRDQRDRVDHTYQVLATLEGTLVRIIDAETGQRGFVITGDERYLEPWQRARLEIPPTMDRLRGLIDDNEAQRRRVGRLDALLQTKLAELQESIERRREGGLDAAREVIVRDRGRRTMDAIRQTVDAMRENERTLLADRSAEARATEARLLAITVIAASLSLIARVGMALLLKRRSPPATTTRAADARPDAS